MARAKKPKVNPVNETYYIAVSDLSLIHNGEEVYPEDSIDKAINVLRENEQNVDEIYIFEVKLTGKYKVKYELEKID